MTVADYRGLYLVALGPEGRVCIPVPLRPLLEAGGVVVPSPVGPGLWLYPLRSWRRMERHIGPRIWHEDRDEQAFLRRHFIAAAEAVALDARGRVVLPPLLRERFSTSDDVAVIGCGAFLAIEAPQEPALAEARERARRYDEIKALLTVLQL